MATVSKKDLAIFSKHLSVMLKSGINVVDALETLQNQAKVSKFKNILKVCSADLRSGVSLSFSFSKFPKVFDQFYQNVIKVGEESATLANSLSFLETKLEKELSLKRKVDEALFYPKVVIGLAFVVAFSVSIYILPKLGDMFRSFDVQLPLATRVLLAIADYMKVNGLYLFIAIILFLVFLRLLIIIKSVRLVWTRFVMSLPIIGPFMVNKETSSFCRNLGIMLSSGIPITRALTISSTTTENALFSHYISELNAGLQEGSTLGSVLQSGRLKKIPAMVTKMVTVGEKSGSLTQMLLYLADNFEESTDDQAKNLSAMIEPVLLVTIAIVVLFIALAIVLPIYQLSDVLR